MPASVCLGPSLEEKPLPSCRLSKFEQTHIKPKAPEVELSAATPAVTWTGFGLMANNREPLGAIANGTPSPEANKASEQNQSVEECGEQTVPLPETSAQLLLEHC